MHRSIASCLLAALVVASSLTGAAVSTAILEADDDLKLLEHIKEDLEPLYKLKAVMQGLAGSRSAAVEAYGGEYQRAVEKADQIFFSVATQLGGNVITMMSSGVVLAVGFQLSGGDSQTDILIWYSWLGGLIIGTMIDANSVLEEHCKAGPLNVVITGSTRGLGKALAREFLLSGDSVVVASRSGPESVLHTINELEENIQEGLSIAKKKQRETLLQAKVVGTSYDVCKPEDVKKLINFAVDGLGSIDIWINNAGTNKGFRPLVKFSGEDITQVRMVRAACKGISMELSTAAGALHDAFVFCKCMCG